MQTEPSNAAFSDAFRTSINASSKQLATSYPASWWGRLGSQHIRWDDFVSNKRTTEACHIKAKPFDLESRNITWTSYPYSLQPQWIWRHYLVPVGSYSEITVEKASSDGIWWHCWRTVSARITKFYKLIEEYGPHRNWRIYCANARKTGLALQRVE